VLGERIKELEALNAELVEFLKRVLIMEISAEEVQQLIAKAEGKK
jgi:hypothetical protein